VKTPRPAERITLLTTPECHLCEEARSALRRIQERTGEPWRERDISGDPELAYEYGDRVPVVLLDGREHGYWRVEEERLIGDLVEP
jgi:glutaredoxin